MRLLFVSLALLWLASACFQPVDPDARVVSSCTGSCPFGACSEECAGAADAGCTTPEACLVAYGCSQAPAKPCSAYTAERFPVGAVGQPTACAEASGSYCVTTMGSFGVRGTFAVVCVDGGATATDCSDVDPCRDGGVPADCRLACGPRYCVR